MMQLEDTGIQGPATGYTGCLKPITGTICSVPACVCACV